MSDRREERAVEQRNDERELTITRVFDAPARTLFAAYSKPEYVLRWFGPVGYPLSLCEMEFRVGGRYRFAMKGPDGELMTPFGGEYLEIVPDRKIAYSNTMEHPGAETMIVTVTFDEQGPRTVLTIHTLFASIAQLKTHVRMGYEQGVASGLAQLADVVSSMGTP
jgi:uncharacterized protein YndB with AHSA1/START domain